METQRSDAAAGWIMFAGVMMITVGIFQVFAGLVALIDDGFYVVTPKYVAQFDATQWGWIHLVIGLIVLVAGFGVFSGNILARTVGVFVASSDPLSQCRRQWAHDPLDDRVRTPPADPAVGQSPGSSP